MCRKPRDSLTVWMCHPPCAQTLSATQSAAIPWAPCTIWACVCARFAPIRSKNLDTTKSIPPTKVADGAKPFPKVQSLAHCVLRVLPHVERNSAPDGSQHHVRRLVSCPEWFGEMSNEPKLTTPRWVEINIVSQTML
jgi:hypothetical protein